MTAKDAIGGLGSIVRKFADVLYQQFIPPPGAPGGGVNQGSSLSPFARPGREDLVEYVR